MDPDRRDEEYGWHMEDARPDHGGASGDAESRSPISGIAGCCARAVSGHAAAAPPRRVMNARRLTLDLPPPESVYRALSLP
jgi:hypothetical protein